MICNQLMSWQFPNQKLKRQSCSSIANIVNINQMSLVPPTYFFIPMFYRVFSKVKKDLITKNIIKFGVLKVYKCLAVLMERE